MQKFVPREHVWAKSFLRKILCLWNFSHDKLVKLINSWEKSWLNENFCPFSLWFSLFQEFSKSLQWQNLRALSVCRLVLRNHGVPHQGSRITFFFTKNVAEITEKRVQTKHRVFENYCWLLKDKLTNVLPEKPNYGKIVPKYFRFVFNFCPISGIRMNNGWSNAEHNLNELQCHQHLIRIIWNSNSSNHNDILQHRYNVK